jgi:hypothetical protein
MPNGMGRRKTRKRSRFIKPIMKRLRVPGRR